MEYTTRVAEVFPRGDFAFSVRFDRPAEFSFLAGQYMFITPQTGQKNLTKHLTISSSPGDPYLEVTKGATGHPFAEALRALQPGDTAVIRGPYGDFTFRGEFSKVAFIAGGIGITPLWSMIQYATEMLYDTDITLLYAAKTRANVLFRERMADISAANPHFSAVITLTQPDSSWDGRTGRINAAMIKQEIPDWHERVFFTSGPLPMVNAMRSILSELNVTEEQIRYEYFPGY